MILDVQQLEKDTKDLVRLHRWSAQRCDESGKRILLSCHSAPDLLRFGQGIFNDPFAIIHTSQISEPARTLIYGELWRSISCFVRELNWFSPSFEAVEVSSRSYQIVADATLIRAVIKSIMPVGEVEVEVGVLPLSRNAAQFCSSRSDEPLHTYSLPIRKRLEEVKNELKSRAAQTTKPTQKLSIAPAKPLSKSLQRAESPASSSKSLSPQPKGATIPSPKAQSPSRTDRPFENQTKPNCQTEVQAHIESRPEPEAVQARLLAENAPLDRHVLVELWDYLQEFSRLDFTPLIECQSLSGIGLPETQRHGAIINLYIELGRSSVVFSKANYVYILNCSARQKTAFEDCRKNPKMLCKQTPFTLRWQISHCYHGGYFQMENVNRLFDNNYLPELLKQLCKSVNQPTAQKGNAHQLEDVGRLPLNHESDKGIGFIAREEGRFGSTCLYESVGEESSPEEHDNDWVDQISFEHPENY